MSDNTCMTAISCLVIFMPDISSGIVVAALFAALAVCESRATEAINPATPPFDTIFDAIETIDNIDCFFIRYDTRFALLNGVMVIGKKTKVT